MENFYKSVERIQKLNLKNNLRTLIDIILIAGRAKGEYEEIPDYTLKFNPLWSLSEKEQADVDKTRADTEYTKAQTAQVYADMQALDASEIRKRLAESGEFTINDVLDEEDAEWGDIPGLPGGSGMESEETINTALSEERGQPAVSGHMEADSVTPSGCGVIVIRDGKILVGERKDSGLLCGPGGHIENGETPEDAAAREAREEFGIYTAELVPVAVLSGMPPEYCPSQVFLCTEFYGEPRAFNDEMENARFEAVPEIMKHEAFLPFRLSIEEFARQLRKLQDGRESPKSRMTAAGGGKGRMLDG